MPLSEHEQQLLDRLEQQFQEEDPKFAKSLEPEPARALSTGRILGGALFTVAGLLLLFLGPHVKMLLKTSLWASSVLP